MKSLNPNHPVSEFLTKDTYQTIVSVLVNQEPEKRLFITMEDFNNLAQDVCLVVHFHEETLELRLVSVEEATAIAREAGGLPL